MRVKTTISVNPLSSFREAFYSGGILFTCVFRAKVKEVFAAGGRYDSLIQELRLNVGDRHEQRRAVGFSLSWQNFVRLSRLGLGSSQKRPEQEIANQVRVSLSAVSVVAVVLFLFTNEIGSMTFSWRALMTPCDARSDWRS